MQSLILIAQILFLSLNSSIPTIKSIGDEVYIGFDNQLLIDLKGCNPEDVNIKISSGTIAKRTDSTYSIFVNIPEDEIKVKLYYKKVICQIKTIKAVRLPNPEITFENLDRTISKAQATQAGKLILKYPVSYSNIGVSNIISFNAAIEDTNGRFLFSTYTRGDALDKNTINMLSKVKSGTRLIINNIITQTSGLGAMNTPGTLTLQIVD